MIKKITGWTLLVGLIVVLFAGAVNRTMAKTGENSYDQVGHSEGRGQAQSQSVSGEDYARQAGQGREQVGNQGFNTTPEDSSVGQSEAVEWFSEHSEVVNVREDALVVTFGEQGNTDITGRAWSFAQEQGFFPQPGDQLRLTGFFEAKDHLEVSQIENLTNGEIVILRDGSGRPMWAGWRRNGS